MSLLVVGASLKANELSKHLEYLAGKKNGQLSLKKAYRWKDNHPKEYRSCSDQYEEMYEDNILEVNFVYGYNDVPSTNSPEIMTIDRNFFVKTYNTLIRSCDGLRSKVCGFEVVRAYRSYAILEKPLSIYRGRQKANLTLRIRLAHSSVSQFDRDNIFDDNRLSTEQEEQTNWAESLFFGGIEGSTSTPCEVCVYHGHARDGGGPDFGPVPLPWRKSNGQPNYSAFQKYQPGYKKLLQSLSAPHKSARLVALMGCYTRDHFWQKAACLEETRRCDKRSLKSYSKNTGFLLSKKLSWPKNWGAMTANLLDTLVNFKCKRALDSNMNELRKIKPKKYMEDYVTEGQFL